MIRCIAIDDEPKALEIIKRYCAKIDSVQLLETFREPLKAIEFIRKEKPDLIFLDINMPDINGLQMMYSISEKPMVIFTTAYSQYAVESYDVHAMDYLLKPISFDRFLKAVNKAIEFVAMKREKPQSPEFIFIKSGAQTHKVSIDEILYLEKEGNYMNIITLRKKILIRENMSDVFNIIPPTTFIRVHKSYIVSTRHISMIETHQITIGDKKIPIGSAYKESLKKEIGLE